MFSKNAFLGFGLALLAASLHGQAQNCGLSISGKVSDEASGKPLPFVNVFVQELSSGVVSDGEGGYLLEGVCAGAYHIIFSHIGCESKKIHLELVGDTVLNVEMAHSATSLGEVVVEGRKETYGGQANVSVQRETIEENANRNLSGLIEGETGVYQIKSGGGIAKPVVHGLYGNRLAILNNGIVQAGQQWGNDHSPEIDPFAVDKITVLKGAGAIEYGGGNLGSIVLAEPMAIGNEPHLHGQLNHTFETNGRGSILNARLEKHSPLVAWRVSGTLKKYGDRKAAHYFLRNTGEEEANLAVQLEKSWKSKLFVDFYASTFNARLGVLRGSHIGNLTDLEEALNRAVPFFTQPDFGYSLDAPKQHVSHHLAKIKAKCYFDEHQSLELVLAGQLNVRKEFDVRRGGREDVPALSLNQHTFNAEVKYARNFGDGWDLKLGSQNIFTDNTNKPETGILPLIPDYVSWKSGFFGTLAKRAGFFHFDLGLRYDFEYQDVAAISQTVPREILRYGNRYHNIAGLLGLRFDLPAHRIGLNSGLAMRNPAINELYSNGLHQGVGGIEEGDPALKTETAIKNTLEYKWIPSPKFSLEALLYHQHFKNYVYLNPEGEIRLTIRGAFPVFRYGQTDANIYGLDLSSKFTLTSRLLGQLKYSYLRGRDVANDIPLVFMPPNRLFGSLEYRVAKPVRVSGNLSLKEVEFGVDGKWVFGQKNLLEGQDFVAPPPGYGLLGMKVSADLVSPHWKIRFFARVDNLLNTSYRDYMNRMRYFADDLGVGVTLGMGFKF